MYLLYLYTKCVKKYAKQIWTFFNYDQNHTHIFYLIRNISIDKNMYLL